MTADSIHITVKLFAIYQETYGVSELHWEFPANTPVSHVLQRAIAEYPKLEKWQSITRFGINLQFVDGETPMHNGDEVVLIPPVSGG
ncbi:MoaD/ThiS family protein [Roseofilum casamattae]|uniref:Molybdopterin synthase sulfur carrier subunit n=1 Tax=Roseofilum casamattae BLCC-M143 TaxID=3022442 RepID=A0ABT7BY63_9CYAN|nr:MoaD/ThiS family protein [Roseofilum casamattae BLCC-M143]